MIQATFRFDETLQTFLERRLRGPAFVHTSAPHASIKHTLETLGVPHTEIGGLFVNDKPATLADRLQHGDDVSVRAASGPHATADAVEPAPRFVADAHLGGLARRLRMAGFDTLYDNHYPDSEIERLAVDTGRIVLTRDRELLKRRGIVHGAYVHALEPEAQLREVAERFALAGLARPFSLCLHCNAPLHAIARDAVRERVPPLAWAAHDTFSTCAVCRRVFWEGSHWRRMRDVLRHTLGV